VKHQKSIDPERLVFIDETWTRTDMGPLRGWAPCGQRLIGKVPHGRWKIMTFIAALRHDRIEAPWLLEGPIDGESFRLYVEKVLLPTLRQGDIVITISAATKVKPCASSSVRRAPSCSSCRNILLT
jgi:hypothetical protein